MLEKAIEIQDDNRYCSEETLHSIICPMRYTSDELQFEEMNLWIIDDRLAYHTFLASDKLMKSLPVLDTSVEKRMDVAIFDQVFSLLIIRSFLIQYLLLSLKNRTEMI